MKYELDYFSKIEFRTNNNAHCLKDDDDTDSYNFKYEIIAYLALIFTIIRDTIDSFYSKHSLEIRKSWNSFRNSY